MEGQFTIGLISLYVIENGGLRYLAAYLRRQGFRVVEVYFKDWANNRFEPPQPRELASLVDVLRREGVGVVGLSVRASAYHRVAAGITRHLREALGVPMLWGGLHVTCLPEECIREADVICLGEGEAPVAELLERLAAGRPFEDVPNLWLRRPDGGIVRNPCRPLRADLDELPFRDYHSPEKYFIEGRQVTRGDPYADAPFYPLMASFGCPFANCGFCGNTIMRQLFRAQGRYYRHRSVENVIRELRYAREHFRNLRAVRFDDGVFGFDAAWLKAFAAAYKREIGLPFSCMADPRVLTEEWLRTLVDAGLDETYMGIQHTERVTHDLYDRHITNEQVLRAARLIRRFGLRASYHVVLDDPVSTEQDMRDLFELVAAIPRPFDLFLFSMTIFPRGPLAAKLLERGLITEDDIEGRSQKVFEQWRVQLSYPRTPDARFWTAMFVLLPKRFVSRRLLRRWIDSPFIRRHPGVAVAAAQAANMAKMPWVALHLVRSGQVNRRLLRRWVSNPRDWISA